MQSSSSAASNSSSVVTATWRNVLVTLYCDTPNAADLDHVGAAYGRLLLRYPKGIRVLAYGKPGIPLPGPETRAAAVDLGRRYGARTSATAIVLPGDGFWVSAARSVVDGITRVLSSGALDHATFKNIPQAVAWLFADETDPTADPADLAQTVRDLTERYGILVPSAWNDLPLRRSTFRPKR